MKWHLGSGNFNKKNGFYPMTAAEPGSHEKW